ncbi:sigma-70 family RNA polymerase sigma factor [Patescibacteria group bacterium]|nr:sigma-70 family RNA polymerase sigma factor [Patescibacteria group bacterium]MBU1703679.1 sigma-70 family RNA polymerase sigma factor [Patescibacteria group bacterium]MBU1953946.1 sigma-70 family RNA polymerase sigma factor [Patescibacteria group bacterium]
MSEIKYSPEQLDAFVADAQRGKTEAFEKLYNAFVDQIYRYTYYRTGREDALDITENVFLKVWENIKSYRVGRRYFSSWIYRIAHNAVVDHYRLNKEAVELNFDIADEKRDADPVRIAEGSLSSEVLMKAISKLNRKHQQVIVLKYINELENREIAKIMRRTEGSLRILKLRALRALRRILEDMNMRNK